MAYSIPREVRSHYLMGYTMNIMVAQQMVWECHSPEKLRDVLATDLTHGLTGAEVRSRQRLQGKNVFQKKEKRLWVVHKLLKQIKNPLVFILLGAGVVTLFLGEFIDTTVIFAALFINVAVGLVQEGRSSRAFNRLRASQERYATVVRNGKKRVIRSEQLVSGDIVEIEAGAHVPADLRILESNSLLVNEAALTGEWMSVIKNTEVLTGPAPINERANMAWMGTLVADGSGVGVVVATGNRTQVGAVASSLGDIVESLTPLQHSIRRIARFLIYIIVAALIVIFALGFYRGESFGEMLLIAIALAVATMPEGLPAAVTVVLALGMESILRRGGLVKNLLAAETLGATTMILTDKTGTLTEAKMQLKSIYTLSTLESENRESWSKDDRAALCGAVLVSDAFVEEVESQSDEEQPRVVVHGRPIERAILLAAHNAGMSQRELLGQYSQLDFIPFSSARRFGASLHHVPKRKRKRLYFSGVPEELLSHATNVYVDGKVRPLDEGERRAFARVQKKKSADGYRFIGVAYRDVTWDHIPRDLHNGKTAVVAEELVFLGFLSFEDPIRDDVSSAIKKVQEAGASVLMVTGDNPETARKVAYDVGIAGEKSTVLLGSDIHELTDNELYEKLMQVKVFARTFPDQKLRIAHVLKNRGEVVAMTGDGINDAPALRSANIGIAVGSGTEVAKEASDLILIGNSFSVIVAAIEEGRKIIANLKKIVAYLLSTSFSEFFVIGSALAVGAPLPLLPGQILWANIVEEGVMSFPLAFEKPSEDLMKQDPRSHRATHVITKELRSLIFIVSVVTGVLLIALYFWLLQLNLPIEEIRTVMFVALSLDAMLFIFSLKCLEVPIWRINILDNPALLGSLGISILLLVAALTLPPLRHLLSLTSLSLSDLALLGGVGLFNLLTIEAAKYVFFERRRKKVGMVQ